jgi:hypothetical protein
MLKHRLLILPIGRWCEVAIHQHGDCASLVAKCESVGPAPFATIAPPQSSSCSRAWHRRNGRRLLRMCPRLAASPSPLRDGPTRRQFMANCRAAESKAPKSWLGCSQSPEPGRRRISPQSRCFSPARNRPSQAFSRVGAQYIMLTTIGLTGCHRCSARMALNFRRLASNCSHGVPPQNLIRPNFLVVSISWR